MADAPDTFWGPVLSALRDRMDLPPGPWRRLPTGKNVVIELGDESILKLVPPYWAEDARREAAALELVPSSGPMPTPGLLALDMQDGWTVLLMNRLPGTILSQLWPSLTSAKRGELAKQLGAGASWLHHLEVPLHSPLAYDWAGHIASEFEAAPQQLAEHGAPAELQDSWLSFLHSVGPLPSPGSPSVLLHGDLSVANVLVREEAGRLQITGLLDLGDASLGEFTHDWLSPGIHNFGGDPAVVQAFCDGYGLPAPQRTPALRAHLLVRSLLYYGWRYLQRKFPLQSVTTWEEVAAIVWPISAPRDEKGGD